MNQDYLDKYREKPLKKTKKVKVKKFQGSGLRIVDADEGFGSVVAPSLLKKNDPKRVLERADDEINPLDPDEMPQVVSVIDERPVEIRLMEEFRQVNKWKAVEEDSGNSLGFKRVAGKSKVNSDSDGSPPRQRVRHGSDSDNSPPRQRPRVSPSRGRKAGSDSDFSPPRKRDKKSPSRRSRRDDDISPPRKRDQRSPKRMHRRDKDDVSPPRMKKTHGGRRVDDGRGMSPLKRKARGSDSDVSPHRRRDERERGRERNSRRDRSPQHRRRQQQNKSDSDASPPRPNRSRVPEQTKRLSRRGSDSDNSPVRRRQSPGPSSTGGTHSGSPVSHQRLTKTLDGKKAGLQTAGALKDELNKVKRQEIERFAKMDDSVSGRYAKTKFRDRATGKLRDMNAELEQKQEEDRKAADRKAQYDKWGKGMKQVEEQQERVDAALHEIAKPLARYKDDEDLDAHLKSLDREGDPMLKFLAKKKAKAAGSGQSKPVYQGPAPPPNRFKIPPGYRWDGVDRSSGYEKEWFQKINSKKALQEESYKWSVEDL